MKEKRTTISIGVTKSANDAIDALCKPKGRTKKWVVAQVLQWFAAQDEATKSLVLGEWSKEMQREMLEAMLRKLTCDDPHTHGSDSVSGAA